MHGRCYVRQTGCLAAESGGSRVSSGNGVALEDEVDHPLIRVKNVARRRARLATPGG